MAIIRIGTRGSMLALAQAHEVKNRLLSAHPSLAESQIEIVPIKTTGDKILSQNLEDIGGKGLFTKEVEEALLDNTTDIGVHSMKDVPVFSPERLVIDCILPRQDPRDAFISKKYASLADLPKGAVMGTSSSRRKAQLLHTRPDLQVVTFRGNVNTRLQKLEDGVAEATLLAIAGLHRIQLAHLATEIISSDVLLPAVAQGAIGIQHRKDDARIAALLAPLNHAPTSLCVTAERAFLTTLEGSCRTPIAALAELSGDTIALRALIAARDGSVIHRTSRSGNTKDAAMLGTDAAQELRALGGPHFFD